jgi:hypothetical protein
MEKKNIDSLIALFTMILAVVGIVLSFTARLTIIEKSISIASATWMFYLGWKTLIESEVIQKIYMLMFLKQLERQAEKEAKEIIENVKQESKD